MKAFIDEHRERFGVEPICQQLQVAPSAYRRHAARQRNPELRCARALRDEMLVSEIERVWQVNLQVYGADKVWRQLNREGIAVARCTVERLMRQQGLRGAMRGKPVKTTRPDPAAPCPLDRVNRQFSATRPNQLWVADFTYVSTWQGFVYVAFVIDVYARYIVGWRVSRSMHTDFVLDALEQALYARQPDRNTLIHHSDRGAQYVSIRYSERLGKPASNPPSAARATATTTRSPKPSMASTRRKSFTDAAPGSPRRPSSWQRWNGSLGSIIIDCLSPSDIFLLPKLRQTTTAVKPSGPSQPDSNQMASAIPGAIHGLRLGPVSVVFETVVG